MHRTLTLPKKQLLVIVAMAILGCTFLFYHGIFEVFPYKDIKHESKGIPNLTGETNQETTFSARRKHLAHVCLTEGRQQPNSTKDSLFPGGTIIDMRHHILFCPVQKAGSSFWTKVLGAISSDGKYNSPYEVKIGKHELQLYRKFHQKIPQKNQENFMQKAVSLMVVRDPYTKLFSAYADKLYHPNHLFWRITGQPIRNVIRKSNSSCGNDITFSDFIKYIIYQSRDIYGSLNNHFTPIHKHCYPCEAKYDYIMKFENFKEDFNYILNDLHTKYNLSISFENLEKETSLHIAELHINISFGTMRQYAQRCNIPAYNFLLRTWRFLQMTGHVPKEIDLPFLNDEHAKYITKGQMLGAVKVVLESDLDWNIVKAQRQEALIQAYQGVNMADIMKLRDIVKPDCDYFGYRRLPHYLFDKRETDFDYFDGLT